jgi:MoxR-like ATPase
MNIVRMRVPQQSPKLAQQAVEQVQALRGMDLKKNPSVSETIDWARALVMLNADSLDKATLENTLTVLLKHESDVQKARRALVQGQSHPLDRGERRGKNRWAGSEWNN